MQILNNENMKIFVIFYGNSARKYASALVF